MFSRNILPRPSDISAYPADGGSMSLKTTGTYPPEYMVSLPRRPQYELLLILSGFYSGYKMFPIHLTLFPFRPNSDLKPTYPSIWS
jgi:hypothetical protein